MTTPSSTPTIAQRLAAFSTRASYDDMSPLAREQAKLRILDALGCAIGASDAVPVRIVRSQVEAFDPSGPCTLIGGGTAPPDRAALYNSALVRYLDFNDSYLAKGETCHPSDNLGAVLAAADYADASGRDLLAALALSYQVQCRLSDVAPVRNAGFDHVTQGTYAVAAGVARALGLDADRTANAIAIAGTAFNALRVTRTGALSHWKGLAYPNMAGAVTGTTFLARAGITGPLEVFEGEKGFMDAVSGYFELDWDAEDLERITHTILKTYNAEIHSQSAIEALLALRARESLAAGDIAHIDLDIFDVAYHIIGGGDEGDKTIVRRKEEADHSLPYLLAVAALDGEVMPAQFEPARILRDDVQTLLGRVTVRPDDGFSDRFPAEMPCRLRLELRDGRVVSNELADYPGFRTRGQTWDVVRAKFDRLSGASTTPVLRDQIAATVADLDRRPVRDLTHLLAAVSRQRDAASPQEHAT
ncbi:MAG: MmgE/PrpD family protein [Gemmatimonadaceae bacterium]